MDRVENLERGVRLSTLGRVDLRRDGNPVRSVLAQPKRLALLAYLTLARPYRFHRRDELLALFWPESDDERARNALNQALHRLRESLGRATLPSRGREDVGIDAARIRCDATELASLFDQGRPAEGVALYAGPLLPGLHVHGAPGFADWLDRERFRLEDRVIGAHKALADSAESRGDRRDAIVHLRSALDLRPANEPLLERLIDLHLAHGDRAGAIADYERCAERVRNELGIELSGRLSSRVDELAAPSTGKHGVRVAGHPVMPDTKPASAADAPAGSTARVAPDTEHTKPPAGRLILALTVVIAAVVVIAGLVSRNSRNASVLPDGDGRVLILPFDVFTEGLAEFGPGMVPVLAANLAQAGALDVVDPRAVLNFIHADERIGDGARAIATDAARVFGAAHVVTGSIATVDEQVRLIAEVRDRGGAVTGQVVVDGERDRLIPLVDSLTLLLVRRIWRSNEPVPQMRLAAVTTNSLAALGAFVRGERLRRAANHDSAVVAYESALREDSTFALAQLRLLEARSWAAPGFAAAAFAEDVRRLRAHLDRLPPTERAIANAWILWYHGDLAVIDSATAIVEKRPNDPVAWTILGEAYVHNRPFVTLSLDSLRMIFDRVLTLDSTAPDAFYHALQVEVEADNPAGYDALLERFAGLGQADRVAFQTALRRLRWGPADSIPEVFAAAIASSDRPASDPLFASDTYELLAAATNNVASATGATADVLVQAVGRAEREARYPDRRLLMRYLRKRTLVELGRGDESVGLLDSFEDNAPVLAYASSLGLVRPGIGGPPPQLLAVPVIGAFSRGIAAARRGDAAATRAEARALEALHEANDTAGLGSARLPSSAAQSFAAVLDALALILEGHASKGAAAFDDALRSIPSRGRLRAYLDVPAWEAARLLAASETERDRGLRMLHTYTQRLGFCCTAALARIEMAQALEQMGDHAAARRLYAQVLTLWRDAAPPVDSIRETLVERPR